MMPFREQLQEYPPIYKLLKTIPPKLAVPPVSPPWRVYVKKTAESGWARKDFPTYKAAYDFLRLNLKKYYDISITSKRQSFSIPHRIVRLSRNGEPIMVKAGDGTLRQKTKVVTIKPPPYHSWCMWCRRFTEFKYFLTHHALRDPKITYSPDVKRCSVCGISEETGAQR